MSYKKGQCIDCPPGERYIYCKNRCETHYWRYVSKSNNIPRGFPNREWFQYHISSNIMACENCGLDLVYSSDTAAISCQAHILPKEHFPSVASDLNNHLTLGGLFQQCQCHGQFDSSWLNASRMPVITLARQRLELFRGNIAPAELLLLPKIFKENKL